MKEKINIILRDDDTVRITYWNELNGDKSLYVSKEIATKIKTELQKLDLRRNKK